MSKIGTLTLFAGCMASGKSALLLNRVAFLRSLGKNVAVAMHASSHRERMYAVSRAGPQEYALRFREPSDLLRFTRSGEILAIDEIQDLETDFAPTLYQLLDEGRSIVVAGRDTNFRGEPFPIMEWLTSHATEHTILTAVCTSCFNTASRSQRFVRGEPAHWDSPIREQGSPHETYESRCLIHHVVPGKPVS
ncbi:MAG: AAA family ATPase [Candidatus Uhrbacteria bacterium]